MFFFFQAEDGIRDADVTGVQTCALPISTPSKPFSLIISTMLFAKFSMFAAFLAIEAHSDSGAIEKTTQFPYCLAFGIIYVWISFNAVVTVKLLFASAFKNAVFIISNVSKKRSSTAL